MNLIKTWKPWRPFPILLSLPSWMPGSPRCVHRSGCSGVRVCPCTRHLLLPHQSGVGWVTLSRTGVDKSARLHFQRSWVSYFNQRGHCKCGKLCSNFLIPTAFLSCFQIQQWKTGVLHIGTLKCQLSHFDYLYWQQISLLWGCLNILKHSKIFGNSLGEMSVVGQVAGGQNWVMQFRTIKKCETQWYCFWFFKLALNADF